MNLDYRLYRQVDEVIFVNIQTLRPNPNLIQKFTTLFMLMEVTQVYGRNLPLTFNRFINIWSVWQELKTVHTAHYSRCQIFLVT